MTDNNIWLKIYVENGDTLVLEGSGDKDLKDGKSGYYPTRWDDTASRIGTVVVGKSHISITEEAKAAFREIVRSAHHTGDDISCLDIHDVYDYDKNGKRASEPRDVCVSYIGDYITRINIRQAIEDEDFFIGCGEGRPRLSLLDELVPA